MATELSRFSTALADSVDLVGRSVVRVEGRRRVAASGIAWSEDGLVVTANHVLERDDELRVGLPDGQTVTAQLVGRDPATDLALVRAAPCRLAVPTWAEGDGRVGSLVLAVARPGKTVQATIGLLSALGGAWRSPMGGDIDRYVQTDLVMYPGFSGGPLADVAGTLLGLNTSALLRNYSVALPASTVSRVAEALLRHGRVRRGYLGLAAQLVRLSESAAAELGQETGLMVMSVEPNGPAQSAGLAMGDTIVALERAPVRTMDDLLSELSGDRVGKKATLRILRGGRAMKVRVTVGERS